MSGGLFVGRISPNTRTSDLEDAFGKYGKITRCEVRTGFAFVTFGDEKDAEDAMAAMQGQELLGSVINIEWTRESGKFSRKSSSEEKCYECGGTGHFARDCRDRRGGGGGRRSPDRYRRDDRRDDRRDERRSRSRDRNSRRSRSPPRREDRRSPSPRRRRSPSPARHRSQSR